MGNDSNLRKISVAKLDQKLRAADDIVLIHTLPGDHFNNVHIPGAINVCVFEVSFTENVKKMVSDKNKEIIVYGSSSKS
ncbi:MAG: rhodanese-like domain-containing protein, partial [Desulfobacterales bacterium]|nr:rhodanese-like domain-containing protein [Desulfobacterales bacterium]